MPEERPPWEDVPPWEAEDPSFWERFARAGLGGIARAAELPLLASPAGLALGLAKGELPGFAVRHTVEDLARQIEPQTAADSTAGRVAEQVAGGLGPAAVNTLLQMGGGPLATGAAGGYQAGLSAYEQARQAGESPLSAGLGAVSDAAVGAVAAPLAGAAALGKFAPQGAGFLRQVLTAGGVDALTGAGQTGATLARQAIQGQDVQNPGQQMLESGLANAGIGIASRGVTRALEPRSRPEPSPVPPGPEVTESVSPPPVPSEVMPSPEAQLPQQQTGVGETPPPPAAVLSGPRKAGGEVPEFKFERLDLPESQRDELRQVLNETLPKGTISWEETEAQAKAHEGKDLSKKAKLTRPEHFALEQGLGAVGKEIETLRAIENRTPEQEAVLNDLVLKRNAMFMASQRAGSETGRALNALKAFRKAGIAALKPEDQARLKLSKTYWDQLDDAGKAALDSLDLKNNDAVNEWLRRVEKPSVLRMITTNFKASILSGIPTNIRNIAGNTAQLFTEMAARPLAAGVEAVRGKFTGEAPRISLKDQPSAYRGLVEGFNSGAAKAWQILKRGQPVVDTTGGGKFNGSPASGDSGAEVRIRLDPFQLSGSKAVRRMGKVLTASFRPLAAMDALFSEMGFQAKRHEVASEMARLKGGDAADYMNNADVLSSANEFAKKVTYQDKPSEAAGLINKLIYAPRQNKVAKTLAAGGEMIVPFVNIPDRVAARMMDATPLGLLYNMGQAKVDWTPEVSQRIAVGMAGTTLMSLGVAGFSNGVITAGVPKDADERAQFYALKKRPYSVKVGGKDVPFRMLGPWGGALAIGAEAAQKAAEASATGDTEANKLMAGAIGGFMGAGKYLLDASYLQTLSKVVGAFEEGGGSQALGELRGQVYNIAAGNVPFSALLRNVAQASDQRVLERPKGVVEAIQQGIPGQTKKFPARLNPYGQETKREESPAMAFIPRDAPVAPLLSENKPDPVDAELAKHGLSASYVGKSLTLKKGAGQEKLTPELQRQYQGIAGTELRKALEKLFASSLYQKMTPERQTKRIEDVMKDARERGQLLFKREYNKQQARQ